MAGPRIAFKDFVSVDGTELSDLSRAVSGESTHERVDASGFNATGANRYLAGVTEQSATVEFFGSYGVGEVHETIYPIHRDRTIVPFVWRPDMTSAVAPGNPELRGNVQVLSYGPGATRGELDTFEVEFVAADEDGLQWYDTAAVP